MHPGVFLFRLAIVSLSLCFLGFPTATRAQLVDVNGIPLESEEQAMNCPQPLVLPPLPLTKVVSCQHADSAEIVMPLKPDSNGRAREKKIRGHYEFREYKIGKMERPYAFDNLMDALPMAGFDVKFSNRPSAITARKDQTWILINVAEEFYNVIEVKEPSAIGTARTAAEIASEINAAGQVNIYGIEFSSRDQSIVEEKSLVLYEILQYLTEHPEVSIVIESDKISPKGTPEDDAEITRERANAVMDWLVAHDVAKARLQPRPAGRNNPLNDNETPNEIQRNERIVLVRLAG